MKAMERIEQIEATLAKPLTRLPLTAGGPTLDNADSQFLLRAVKALITIAAQRAKTIYPPPKELMEERKKDLAEELELYFEERK